MKKSIKENRYAMFNPEEGSHEDQLKKFGYGPGVPRRRAAFNRGPRRADFDTTVGRGINGEYEVSITVTGEIYHGSNSSEDPSEFEIEKAIVNKDVPEYNDRDVLTGKLLYKKGQEIELIGKEEQEIQEKYFEELYDTMKESLFEQTFNKHLGLLRKQLREETWDGRDEEELITSNDYEADSIVDAIEFCKDNDFVLYRNPTEEDDMTDNHDGTFTVSVKDLNDGPNRGIQFKSKELAKEFLLGKSSRTLLQPKETTESLFEQTFKKYSRLIIAEIQTDSENTSNGREYDEMHKATDGKYYKKTVSSDLVRQSTGDNEWETTESESKEFTPTEIEKYKMDREYDESEKRKSEKRKKIGKEQEEYRKKVWDYIRKSMGSEKDLLQIYNTSNNDEIKNNPNVKTVIEHFKGKFDYYALNNLIDKLGGVDKAINAIGLIVSLKDEGLGRKIINWAKKLIKEESLFEQTFDKHLKLLREERSLHGPRQKTI